MKKLLLIILMFVSAVCIAQTEKQIRAIFPRIDFAHFNRSDIELNKSGKSTILAGVSGDSVFLCYITNRKVESIDIYARYRYNDQEHGTFYYIENIQAAWIPISKKTIIAKCYIGNIKDIELSIKGYKYEILLTEHAHKKEYTLYEIIIY